jgi:hypothetical protein
VLVAVAGRFERQGETLASLLARLGAVSTYTRMIYWSVTHQAWRPLLDEASALSAADPGARRGDYGPDELHEGARLHVLYDDSEPLGPVVSEVELRRVGPDGFELVSRNVLPARLFGFVVAPPGDIQTLLQVEPDGAPGRFRYYALSNVAVAAMAAMMVPDASHINRAVATFRFVAGIPGDTEPPAAPR